MCRYAHVANSAMRGAQCNRHAQGGHYFICIALIFCWATKWSSADLVRGGASRNRKWTRGARIVFALRGNPWNYIPMPIDACDSIAAGHADIYEPRQRDFRSGVCRGGARGSQLLSSLVEKYNGKLTRGAILHAFFCGRKIYFCVLAILHTLSTRAYCGKTVFNRSLL